MMARAVIDRPAVNPPREELSQHWRNDCATRPFDFIDNKGSRCGSLGEPPARLVSYFGTVPS